MKKALLTAAFTAVSLGAISQTGHGWFYDPTTSRSVNHLQEFMETRADIEAQIIARSQSSIELSEPKKTTSAAKKKTGCEFDGRVGTILITNDSLYPVNVYLIHPDSGMGWPSPDYAWTVSGTKSILLSYNGGKATVGSDWGLKLGGSSMHCIGSVSSWDCRKKQFQISTKQFFQE